MKTPGAGQGRAAVKYCSTLSLQVIIAKCKQKNEARMAWQRAGQQMYTAKIEPGQQDFPNPGRDINGLMDRLK